MVRAARDSDGLKPLPSRVRQIRGGFQDDREVCGTCDSEPEFITLRPEACATVQNRWVGRCPRHCRATRKGRTPTCSPWQIVEYRDIVVVERSRISNRGISLEINSCQLGAVGERGAPDGGDALAYRHVG